MSLQRDRDIRLAVSKIVVPAVDGLQWKKKPPEGEEREEAGEPPTPILSILQFSLQPRASSSLRDAFSVPRQLWHAMLHYVSTVPGFRAVKWGLSPREEEDEEEDKHTPAAWRTFQRSMGLTSILAMLDLSVRVSNRCAKLTASLSMPQLFGEAHRGGGAAATVLDMVSATLDTTHVSSPEQRSAFAETWNTLVASVAAVDDEQERASGADNSPLLRCSTHVWLEHNAPAYVDPTAAELAAAIRQTTFTAFLAWNGAHYDRHRVDDVCARWQPFLSSLHGDNEPPTVSKTTVQLADDILPHDVKEQKNINPPRLLGTQFNGLTSLLDFDIQRQCSPSIATLDHADNRFRGLRAYWDSIDDARHRRRLFPAPRGFFLHQGELYIGHQPIVHTWPKRGVNHQPLPPWLLVDVVWMRIKRGALPKQFPLMFERLADDVAGAIDLPGFIEAHWARDVDNKSKVAVLTVWEDHQAYCAALPAYRRLLDDFASSSIYVASPLTHQTFSIARQPYDRTGLERPMLDREECLELTDFHVCPGALERHLFAHAYLSFTRMMAAQNVPGPPDACYVLHSAGWHPVEVAETGQVTYETDSDSDWQHFTGVIKWKTPAGRQEWYGDLFKKACESYELFGYTLDVLKMLAAGGIETRFLQVQPKLVQ